MRNRRIGVLGGMIGAASGLRKYDVTEHAQAAARRVQRYGDARTDDRRQPAWLGGKHRLAHSHGNVNG